MEGFLEGCLDLIQATVDVYVLLELRVDVTSLAELEYAGCLPNGGLSLGGQEDEVVVVFFGEFLVEGLQEFLGFGGRGGRLGLGVEVCECLVTELVPGFRALWNSL